MGNSDTLWLNVMNVLLGGAVLILFTVIAIRAGLEWRSHRRHPRHRPL